MSIKRKIKYKGAPLFINEDEEYCEELAKTFKGEKIKKPIEKKKEELHERDRPRYEEQSEEEYYRHCERFFKGRDESTNT